MSKTLFEPISLIIVITAVIVAASIGLGYHIVTGEHDSKIEQTAETAIDAVTGYSVDLTPSSPDPDGHGSKEAPEAAK